MRIAALYDIHGNLPALEAVLNDARAEGVDLVVVGGDVVPGPMARACMDLLLGLDVPTRFLSGNGDADVLAALRGEPLTRVPAVFHETMRWVGDTLTAAQVEAMAAWPATVRVEDGTPGGALFCHATPDDDNAIFTRLTPDERLAPVLEGAGAGLVVCGHTHMQFDRIVAGVRVVNAGSVGMPFGRPGAYWLLLDGGPQLRRTTYDLGAAEAAFRETGYPGLAVFSVSDPPAEADMLKVFEAAALA